MKKMKWLTAVVVMVMCVFGFASCGSSDEAAAPAGDPVKVTCENGVMVGVSSDGVTSFKGVPYAKPPVDDLRWKAPVAPDPSDEEIDCSDFGYTALQYEWPTEPASSFPKNEDCLTLNIWEADGTAEADAAKPVMVFFHGGAYGWGGTTDPMYDGQNFAAAHDDAILITCNYRLGLMSWADFSQIEGGEEYTDINLGIRDHIAALEWIQKNIEAFGGDPDNVTIFGESAGGWSTTALTISPKARGLFKRAIAQSGGMPVGEREDAQAFADYIMEASGAKNMDDLLAISGDEWMELDGEKWIADECCGVVTDGDIIPEDLDGAIKDAAESGIQMIVGTNNDEWNYFQEDSEGETADEKFASWVEGMDAMYDEAYEGADAEGKAALEELIKYEESIVPSEYSGDEAVKSALAKSGFVTETWRYEILNFADKYADAGGDIYAYLWKVPSTRDNMYKSAVHAVELAYVFNNLEDDIYAGEVDPDTAAKAQQAWINFAAKGDPSIEGAEWTKYNTDTRDTMVIEKDGWKCESDPSKTARELLTKAYGDEPYRVW
ncbi:MAG: carboxylesterase family protein [Bacillota bacterium]|nr:carboxylesterase family protein [Bacillota bacterium]